MRHWVMCCFKYCETRFHSRICGPRESGPHRPCFKDTHNNKIWKFESETQLIILLDKDETFNTWLSGWYKTLPLTQICHTCKIVKVKYSISWLSIFFLFHPSFTKWKKNKCIPMMTLLLKAHRGSQFVFRVSVSVTEAVLSVWMNGFPAVCCFLFCSSFISLIVYLLSTPRVTKCLQFKC